MRTRVISLTTACLALGALSFGVGAAPATSHGGDRSAEPSLPHSAHGQQAIRLLGDQLDEAAARNGWTPAQLRNALATDSTAWVDRTGRVFYKDLPAPPVSDTPDGTDVPPFPLPNTFLLHSNPTSTKKLFIDFDGTTVSDTLWNSEEGVPDGFYPAWDPDANGAAFTDSEKEKIQTIWQRVAEDYAPFEVDVTTEDPGDAGLVRTDSSDQAYGTRALVTPSTVAEGAICGTPVPSCGGVAYINVYGQVEPGGSQHQPAWIFPQSLGPNDPKDIAEAVAHEVGHNFSLQHDGITNGANQGSPCATTQLAYYCGHNQWAPIMGAGYYRPVTQWSKGEYATANNTSQDDVALIAARVPYRTDENDGTVAGASPGLPASPAFIATRTDTDTFLLGTCSGTVSLTATGWPLSQDLDIKLDLLTSAGAVQASADPPSAFVSAESASGLNAAISTSVPSGTYYARVDGVGVGTGVTGYTDYASLGAYTLAATGCLTPTAPSAPVGLTVTPDPVAQTAHATWAVPASDGHLPITSYDVLVDGTVALSGIGRDVTLPGFARGSTHTVSVRAVNVIGAGPAATTAVSVANTPAAPGIGKAKSGKKGGKKTASVAWSAPSDTGGLPITGYQVIVVKAKNGKVVKTVSRPGSKTSYVAKLRAGKYRFVVVALNSLGAGARSATSKAVKAR
jgi:hypothetical protein